MAKKSKQQFETFTGPGNRIPHAVLDSLVFVGASDRAKSFLFALITEFHRRLTTIIFINLFAPGLGA